MGSRVKGVVNRWGQGSSRFIGGVKGQGGCEDSGQGSWVLSTVGSKDRGEIYGSVRGPRYVTVQGWGQGRTVGSRVGSRVKGVLKVGVQVYKLGQGSRGVWRSG